MKEFSVILVDDDQLILDDLKTLIDWKKLGFTICATANNGMQALKKIKSHKPHILITDVLMPGMNGLELIVEAQKLNTDLKILMISSYDEFDYVRKALNLGVHDYLLKNEITAISFSKKLTEIASTIEKSTQISESFLQHELAQYFQNSLSVQNIPLSLSSIRDNQYYFFIAGQTLPFSLNMQQISSDILSVQNYLKSVLDQQETISISFSFNNDRFVIFALSIESSYQEKEFLRVSIGRNLWHRFFSSSKHPCSLFYCPRPITLAMFRQLYRDALPFIQYYSMFSQEKPLNLEILMQEKRYIPQNHSFPFHTLDGNPEYVEDQILKIRDYLYQCEKGFDLAAIMNFYRNFCIHIETLSQGHLSIDKSHYFYSFEPFLKWIFNTYQDCVSLKWKNTSNQFSASVRSAIEYMNEQYSNYTLTAEMIADHIHLSSSRLGVLFKQETNRTINEYLTDIRMKQAIHLLKNSNMKIYEISEQCGYRSSQYFSQLFNSYTGKRPIDYRKS